MSNYLLAGVAYAYPAIIEALAGALEERRTSLCPILRESETGRRLIRMSLDWAKSLLRPLDAVGNTI